MGSMKFELKPDDKADIYFTIEVRLDRFLSDPTSMFIETLKQLKENGLLDTYKIKKK